MDRRFEGMVSLVTGAGSGIGKRVSEQLVDEGAQVVAVDIDETSLGKLPDSVTGVCVDVSNAVDVSRAFERADRLGDVEVVCAVAGVGSAGTALDTGSSELDRLYEVNVRGVYLTCREALRRMVPRRSGSVVTVASTLALVGAPQRVAYAATKGAVAAMTRAMAVDHAADGVRLNCICPGTVDSPWVDGLLENAPDAVAAREQLVARQPMGRLGTPQEIAEAILFLASPAASFATGSLFVVDGGHTAR